MLILSQIKNFIITIAVAISAVLVTAFFGAKKENHQINQENEEDRITQINDFKRKLDSDDTIRERMRQYTRKKNVLPSDHD